MPYVVHDNQKLFRAIKNIVFIAEDAISCNDGNDINDTIIRTDRGDCKQFTKLGSSPDAVPYNIISERYLRIYINYYTVMTRLNNS